MSDVTYVNIGPGTVERVTDKAVLFKLESDEKVWLPKSQLTIGTLDECFEDCRVDAIMVNDWIAETKNLEVI